MKTVFLPALKLTALLLLLLSGGYTLTVWGMAQCTPQKGKGDTIRANGHTYFSNIGQAFEQDRYFWSRPSAVSYNAAGSGGSNDGPSNPVYLETVQERIRFFLEHNPGIPLSDVPVEMVTASGSGLDPDISPRAALVQIKRIAHVRNIPEEQLVHLVHEHTEKPLWGLLGPEKINVLKLNISLDALK